VVPGGGEDRDGVVTAGVPEGAGQLDVFAGAARDYLTGRGPFPERSAVTSVSARFMVDFYEMIYRWAEWATGVVGQWPDDPSQAEPTLDLDRYILQRAELRAARDPGDQ
jgi:hypothetical protein